MRLSILDRDGWLCQIRGPGCTTKATCVDHIVATEDGGAWWDSSNLRASCFACNNNRRGSYGGRRWRTVATVITLVTGPQTQTSAYLASHAQPDDVIADHA
ncbi:MAG: HNH endonuclease, partial [Pseudonocardiaceae bacterium]